jgi:hypothetical protein
MTHVEQRDDTQTKGLVRRTRKGMSTMVSRFNRYIKQMAVLVNAGEAPKGAILPKRLNTKRLWKIDIDDVIWNDSGLDVDLEEDRPPRWMEDTHVRKGIAALLIVDRCREEKVRLEKEIDAMLPWIKHRALVLDQAATDEKGKFLKS